MATSYLKSQSLRNKRNILSEGHLKKHKIKFKDYIFHKNISQDIFINVKLIVNI